MAIRVRLGTFTEVADDPLGRTYVGWFPRMTEAEAWESGRGMHRIGADRIERERFALVVGGGIVCAVAELSDHEEHDGRTALRGELLEARHPVYDAYIGGPDPIANASRNPIAYETLPAEVPYIERECYCGCGELTTGPDFLPGHDVRAMQDRVRMLFGGSPKAFLDWFDRELSTSGDVLLLDRLATLYSMKNRAAQAESLWRRIANIDVEYLTDLGYGHDRHGYPDRAETIWRIAAEKKPAPNILLALAKLHRDHGEMSKAEIALREAAALGSLDALVALADLHVTMGNHAEAVDALRTAADLGDVEALPKLGVLLVKLDEFDEAEMVLRRAADLGRLDALLVLGDLLTGRGKIDEADTVWRMVTDLGDADTLDLLGEILVVHGRPDEAEAVWCKAIALGSVLAADNVERLHHDSVRLGKQLGASVKLYLTEPRD